MTKNDIIAAVRNVENFPVDGVLFKDFTTVFKESKYLTFITDEISNFYKNYGITKVVGIESRGFIIGSIIAYKLNAGFVPIRKPGKLPSDKYSISYELEYGTDTIELHKDAISQNDIVLIHDDVLATGGTAKAAYELVSKAMPKAIYINFISEISFLNGRKRFENKDVLNSYIEF